MNFTFASAAKIIFGNGSIRQAASIAKHYGGHVLVVAGKSLERSIPLLEQLKVHRIKYCLFHVDQEPTTDMIEAALKVAHDADIQAVLGMGGGSVIDAGKAIAALCTNPGQVLDYLEVIGEGQPLQERPLPYIAIPTTAGTGAEVTKNAVLTSPEHNVKVSLRSDLMIPDVAIVDPELTYSMPRDVAMSTGLDALTQLLESYVTHQANPLTDGICREGLRRAARSLLKSVETGDHDARQDMCVASLFGGLALANAKLGAVHGFAGPIGGMFHAPHGVVCARLLPYVVEENVRVLTDRNVESDALERFHEVARIVCNRDDASAKDGVDWIQALCEEIQVPMLATFGVRTLDIPAIVEKAKGASSMKGNPVQLSDASLRAIIERAI